GPAGRLVEDAGAFLAAAIVPAGDAGLVVGVGAREDAREGAVAVEDGGAGAQAGFGDPDFVGRVLEVVDAVGAVGHGVAAPDLGVAGEAEAEEVGLGR